MERLLRLYAFFKYLLESLADKTILILFVSIHGIGLSRVGLSISNDSSIVSLKCLLNQPFGVIRVNLFITHIFWINLIEIIALIKVS